jgi:hypothetical protein
VDLEVDDPARAEPFLERLFPDGAPETLGWRSARGEHRLFLWDARLPALAPASVVSFEDGAIELRMGGEEKQVASVCPPTPCIDGSPRSWNGTWRIARFPEPLIAKLERIAREQKGRDAAPLPFRPVSVEARDRYARSALVREIEIVAVAGPGTRNRTLNRAAFNLGQLVGSGALGREEVEVALRDAAFSIGLHEREIEATLRSGLEAGLKNPRTPPGPGDDRKS